MFNNVLNLHTQLVTFEHRVDLIITDKYLSDICLLSIFLFFFSCNMKLNLDYLLERVWECLSLSRIYTKKPGRAPDFNDPIILRSGANVEHVCHSIHRSIAAVLKYALVWVSYI